MKVLIIEDEALSAAKLRDYLKRYDPGINVLACLGSVSAAIEWFNQHENPDLVFLDVHLSDGSCFNIFKSVAIRIPVIFTTAHDRYALEAFKLNSIDYLLKPIRFDAFKKALDKYHELQHQPSQDEMGWRLASLLHHLEEREPEYRNRFLVRSGNRMQHIPVEQIAYFMADEKITLMVTTKNKKFAIDDSLDILQQQLDHRHFYRINRKFLIRITALKAIHPFFKGRLRVELEPHFDAPITISNGRARYFKEWLNK